MAMATEEINRAAVTEGVQNDRDDITEQVTLEVSFHRTHSDFHFY